MNELKILGQIYIWLGIDILNKPVERSRRKILHVLRNVFFPFLLHINVIFLQFITANKFQDKTFFSYSKILDFIMVLLPCSLWWSIYNERNSVRLLIQLILHVKERYKIFNKTLKIFIFGAIIYWLTFTVSSIITSGCILERSFIHSNNNISSNSGNNSFLLNVKCKWKNITRESMLHLQELLMPFFFAILYFTICYAINKILDCCHKTLLQLNVGYDSQIVLAFLKEYIEIVKCAEKFADIFSLPLLWFIWQVMCYISLVFLDTLSLKVPTYFNIIYIFITTISFVGIIVALSFCADEIPMRVDAFKMALYDMKIDRLFKSRLVELTDIIDIELNRQTLSITVFRIIRFDRCFFLKMIATILAHSVIYIQLSETETVEVM